MSVFKNTFHRSLLAVQCCLYALSSEEADPNAPGARTMSASVRHVEGKGVGYNDGYTTLEVFIARNRCQYKWVPFLDVRGHVFNNATYAANAGVGLRYIRSPVAWGVNGYYDYRNTRAFHYNQVGVGLEAVGSFWSVQLNTYLPVGRTRSPPYDISYQGTSGPAQFWGFQGNRLLLQFPGGATYNAKEEVAFRGVDASFTMRPFKKGPFSLDWGLGPYYFLSAQDHNTAVGGRVNLGVGFTEYLALNVTTTYDTLFRQRVQAGLRVTIPFGRKNAGASCSPLPSEASSFYVERLSRGADRGEIIVVDAKKIHREGNVEEAVNPRTGRPYLFYFVDNQSHSAGTYEDPFPTLQEAFSLAHPGDVVYVYPGSGASYETRCTLLDDERLLSASFGHVLETKQGPITLPAQTALSPSLHSVQDGPMFTLGHRNQISGFILNHTHSGSAVVGEGKEGLVFANNTATAPLSLIDCYGSIALENNTLDAGLLFRSALETPAHLAVVNNVVSSAIKIECSGEAAVHLDMRENTSAGDRGIIDVCASDSAHVTGSIARNGLQGIQWQGTGSSSMHVAVSNNTIHSTADQGIHLSARDQASLSAAVNHNTVVAPLGMKVESQSLATMHVTHNAFQGIKGIQCLHSGDSAPDLVFINNTLISDETVLAGDVKGIEIELRERAHLANLRIAENSWTSPRIFPLGSDPQGLYVKLKDDAMATCVDISNNALTLPINAYHPHSSPAGICIALRNNGNLSEMVLSGNKIDFPVAHYISDTAPQGICLHPTDSAVVTHSSIVSNKVTFAPIQEPLKSFRSNGVMLLPCDHVLMGSVETPLLIQNNTITVAEGIGIGALSKSDGDVYAHVVNNSIELGPKGRSSVGVLTIPVAAGKLFVDIDTNRIEGNDSGWFGVYVNNQGSASQGGTVRNNSITHVRSDRPVDGGGIGIVNFAEGSLQVPVEGNSLSGNAPYGVVGAGSPQPTEEGQLRLSMQGNQGHGDLAPDDYLLWNRKAASPSSVTYRNAGSNSGSFKFMPPEGDHFISE
jgi:hypothetical protein